MEAIHFLNVNNGDCSIIEHNSGRVTVIDVCNAKPSSSIVSQMEMFIAKAYTTGTQGNFQQKEHPVNPIAYLQDHGISSIFRYILTHPDMDHMDGIKALFTEFSPFNFWDTGNHKEMSSSSWGEGGSQYSKEDWDFYKSLRNSGPGGFPKRLTLLSGATGKYWNMTEEGTMGGDGLYILAPTQELVDAANNSDEYNDCSYVLLYYTNGHRIVFGGDSHNNTWEHVLDKYADCLEDIDLLIAPHHGRSSGRSYNFLDVLRPKLTFFGNAPSKYLAYNAWRYRKLPFVTNNQANCMVVDTSQRPMNLYVTNKSFANRAIASKFIIGGV